MKGVANRIIFNFWIRVFEGDGPEERPELLRMLGRKARAYQLIKSSIMLRVAPNLH